MPHGAPAPAAPNRPEKKFGPFAGGLSVAVWLNTVETPAGPRQARSITISPRRYRDAQTGQFKDASSYRPSDLAALIFGLQEAQRFIFTAPLPGQEDD